MKTICCIVGAGDMSGNLLVIPDGAYVIAADAGLQHLMNAGISPNLIIGDFDSIDVVPTGDNVITLNPEKDDTDMMVAVKEALARGYNTIIIYGGLGGRFDHTFANIQTLIYIANNDARGYLVGCGNICTVIKNGGISFDPYMQGTISVFCQGNEARGVDLVGLKYPLANYTMTCDFPIGVSNEFTGSTSSVYVRDGILSVIWNAQQIELNRYSELY